MSNKIIDLYTGSTGINARLDPIRLQVDPNKLDLSEGVNVYVDDSGMLNTRSGTTLQIAGVFHSVFCDKGDAFLVQDRTSDAAIMRIASDCKTLEGVRSELTKAARCSFAQVNDATFYVNGYENGYIRNGASYAWPVNAYFGPDTSRDFTIAPVGQHIAHRAGTMAIAKDETVWFNHTPFIFGLFNLKSGFVAFDSRVLMVKPVAEGWFISDENRVWFLRGDTPTNFKQERVSEYPALEWGESAGYISAATLGLDNAPSGHAACWVAADGVYLGFANGSVMNLTENKLAIPASTTGASVIFDRNKLVSILLD